MRWLVRLWYYRTRRRVWRLDYLHGLDYAHMLPCGDRRPLR